MHKIYLVPLVLDVLWVYGDLPGLEPVLPVGPAAGNVVLPQVHRHLAEAEGDPEVEAACLQVLENQTNELHA